MAHLDLEAAQRRVEGGAVAHLELPCLAPPRHSQDQRAVEQPQARERRPRPAHQTAPGMPAVWPRLRHPRLDHRDIGPEEFRPLRIARVLPGQQVPPRRLQVGLDLAAKEVRRRLAYRRPGMGPPVRNIVRAVHQSPPAPLRVATLRSPRHPRFRIPRQVQRITPAARTFLDVRQCPDQPSRPAGADRSDRFVASSAYGDIPAGDPAHAFAPTPVVRVPPPLSTNRWTARLYLSTLADCPEPSAGLDPGAARSPGEGVVARRAAGRRFAQTTMLREQLSVDATA